MRGLPRGNPVGTVHDRVKGAVVRWMDGVMDARFEPYERRGGGGLLAIVLVIGAGLLLALFSGACWLVGQVVEIWRVHSRRAGGSEKGASGS